MFRSKRQNQTTQRQRQIERRRIVDQTPQRVHKVYDTPAGQVHGAERRRSQHRHRGEFVSIIGKSGSGKTTLINMLTGIDRPTQGEIFIGGTPVHRSG